MSKDKRKETLEETPNVEEQIPAEQAEQTETTPDVEPQEDWQAKYQETESKYQDVNDRFLRLAAEYDNFRKRTQREREKLHADAVSQAVLALLPTYDNLERALKAETTDNEYKKGVELTMIQLTESLKGLNVNKIEADAGTAFDPNKHNAVSHIESEDFGESVISEVFQQGFCIDDKVIRHAMVQVAN